MKWLVVALGKSNYPGELAISSFLKIETEDCVVPSDDVVLEAIKVKRAAAEKPEAEYDEVFKIMKPEDYHERKFIGWDTVKQMMEEDS